MPRYAAGIHVSRDGAEAPSPLYPCAIAPARRRGALRIAVLAAFGLATAQVARWEAPMRVVSASAAPRKVKSPPRRFDVADFGATGDGVTNDRSALQAAIDHVHGAGGGDLHLRASTYRIQCDPGLPARSYAMLLLRENVGLQMNGGTLRFEVSGKRAALLAHSHTRLCGGTLLACTMDGPEAEDWCGYWQSPLLIGAPYDSIAPNDPLSEVRDVHLRSLRLWGDRPGVAALSVMSGSHQVRIEECEVLPSDRIRIGFAMDWGVVGSITSADARMAANRAEYEAGRAYTTHPHNVIIRKCHLGALTRPVGSNIGPGENGSTGLRLSACYDVRAEDVTMERVTNAGIVVVGGDLGFEFARPAERLRAHRNLVFRRVSAKRVDQGYGLYVWGLADNVYRSQTSHGYTPMLDPVCPMGVRADRCEFRAAGSTSYPASGIYLQHVRGGVEVTDCYFARFPFGLRFCGQVQDCSIRRSTFAASARSGVQSTPTDRNNSTEDCRFPPSAQP